jgi:hypothetical protein
LKKNGKNIGKTAILAKQVTKIFLINKILLILTKKYKWLLLNSKLLNIT